MVDCHYSSGLGKPFQEVIIPDFITHYSRGEPFRSLSSVPPKRLPEVLNLLNEENTWGLSRFSDLEYLSRRRIVEEKMRREFVAKGGKPDLIHPIYCFLGRSADFEKHPGNKPYLLSLESLPEGSVSFTYGDSMFSLNEDYRQLKGGSYLSELAANIYTQEELPKIFYHLDYQSENRLHIEAQLWTMPCRP